MAIQYPDPDHPGETLRFECRTTARDWCAPHDDEDVRYVVGGDPSLCCWYTDDRDQPPHCQMTGVLPGPEDRLLLCKWHARPAHQRIAVTAAIQDELEGIAIESAELAFDRFVAAYKSFTEDFPSFVDKILSRMDSEKP